MNWKSSLAIVAEQFRERAKAQPKLHGIRFAGTDDLKVITESDSYKHLTAKCSAEWGEVTGATHDSSGLTILYGDASADRSFDDLGRSAEPALREFVVMFPGVIRWRRFLPSWKQAVFAVGHFHLPGSAHSVSYSIFGEQFGIISSARPFDELSEKDGVDLTVHAKGNVKLPPPWYFERLQVDLFTASYLTAEYLLSFPDQPRAQTRGTCVFWPVTLATKQGNFGRKELYLDTRTLDPITRVSLDLLKTLTTCDRRLLKFRPYFTETKLNQEEFHDFSSVLLDNYVETEDGRETSISQALRDRHGPGHLIPPGARQHDIEMMFEDDSPPHPDPAVAVNLSQREVDSLAYFLNDVAELSKSKFVTHRAPTLSHTQGSADYRLENLSLENARAYMMIFRRLYMEEEPGNFTMACHVYSRHFLNKRITKWVSKEVKHFHKELNSVCRHFLIAKQVTFKKCELLNAFLYTHHFHQPGPESIADYNKVVSELGSPVLAEWLFYTTLTELSTHFSNVYPYLQNDYVWYVNAKKLTPSFPLPEMSPDPNRRLRPTYRPICGEEVRRHAVMLADELKSDPVVHGKPLQELLSYCEEQLRLRLEIPVET